MPIEAIARRVAYQPKEKSLRSMTWCCTSEEQYKKLLALLDKVLRLEQKFDYRTIEEHTKRIVYRANERSTFHMIVTAKAQELTVKLSAVV